VVQVTRVGGNMAYRQFVPLIQVLLPTKRPSWNLWEC